MLDHGLTLVKEKFVGTDALSAFALVFFGSAFFVAPATLWTMTFYVGFVPVILYRLVKGELITWQHPVFITTGLLLGWTALTLLWGDDPGQARVQKYAFAALFTGIYVIGLTLVLQKPTNVIRLLGSVLIVAGTLNAAWSCLHFMFDYAAMLRLGGWAVTRHPILGSLVMGVCCLFALDRLLREQAHRLFYATCVTICLVFIALAQSRGAYISIASGMIVLLMAVSPSQRLKWLLAATVTASLGIFFAFLIFHLSPLDIIHAITERGSSHRPEIWAYTMQRVMERPLTGHGPAAYLGLAGFPFPHDLYLSTLFYYGFVGLVLFLTLLGLCILWLIRHWSRDHDVPLMAALLMHALCGGLTDLAQLAQGPTPLWIILWLPLTLIFSRMTAGASRHPRLSPSTR